MTSQDLRFELFDYKQKFLREIPHPRLLAQQAYQLRIKGKLDHTDKKTYATVALTPEDQAEDLMRFLENLIQEELRLKHQIAQAAGYEELVDTIERLFDLRVRFLLKLQSYLTPQASFPDEAIKMSTSMDVYAILKWIQTLNLKENEIKNYLCREIEKGAQEADILVNSCLQANKILQYG